MESVEDPKPAPNTSLFVLNELNEKDKEELVALTLENDSVKCGQFARAEIERMRSSAISSKSFFTYLFICDYAGFSLKTVYDIVVLCIVIFIQVVIPLTICITQQPIKDLSPQFDEPFCPNRTNTMTKISALVLSLFFVSLTISLCNNKLTGFNFLRTFVYLGPVRQRFIELGIVTQMLSMGCVGFAQYMLFIGNGEKFVALLLQSLAMQFCLTADQKLVGDKIGTWVTNRVKNVAQDSCLCNGIGVGEPHEAMPDLVFNRVKSIKFMEKIVLTLLISGGVAWSISLAFCM